MPKVVQILIPIIAAIFLVVLLLRDQIEKRERTKNNVRIIKFVYRILYSLGFLGIIFSALDGYFKFTETDINRDPLMNICIYPNDQNPCFRTTNNADSLMLNIRVCNIGKGKAFNLRDKEIFVIKHNNQLYFQDSVPTPSTNESLILDTFPKWQLFLYPIQHLFVFRTEDVYFCFSLSYTNETGKPKSFYKIFHATPLLLDTSLIEVDSIRFAQIKNFLHKYGKW